MKLAIALLMFSTVAQAELFYADKDIEITLYEEQCSPSLPAIKLAKVEAPDHSGSTTGCWELGQDKTYSITIDLGEGTGSFYKYDIYRSKFTLIKEK